MIPSTPMSIGRSMSAVLSTVQGTAGRPNWWVSKIVFGVMMALSGKITL